MNLPLYHYRIGCYFSQRLGLAFFTPQRESLAPRWGYTNLGSQRGSPFLGSSLLGNSHGKANPKPWGVLTISTLLFGKLTWKLRGKLTWTMGGTDRKTHKTLTKLAENPRSRRRTSHWCQAGYAMNLALISAIASAMSKQKGHKRGQQKSRNLWILWSHCDTQTKYLEVFKWRSLPVPWLFLPRKTTTNWLTACSSTSPLHICAFSLGFPKIDVKAAPLTREAWERNGTNGRALIYEPRLPIF